MRKIILALGAAFFLIFCAVISAFVILCMQGCEKEKDENRVYNVTLSYYSQNPKFEIRYIDNGTLHTDTIYAKTFSKSIKVLASDFSFEPSIGSLIQTSSDSLYIRADVDGKKVEKGFRSLNSLIVISVWLQDAK